jgi:hypothetical protein
MSTRNDFDASSSHTQTLSRHYYPDVLLPISPFDMHAIAEASGYNVDRSVPILDSNDRRHDASTHHAFDAQDSYPHDHDHDDDSANNQPQKRMKSIHNIESNLV